jgi:hypothetical protein
MVLSDGIELDGHNLCVEVQHEISCLAGHSLVSSHDSRLSVRHIFVGKDIKRGLLSRERRCAAEY